MSEQATHYLLEIRNCKVVKRYAMTEEDYHIVLDGLERTSTMRTIMEGFICFHEALKELETWCCEAPQNGEYLTRNLHTAERLCRGVLFEYRSFLDHTERILKKAFGNDSEAVTVFKQGTNNAYDRNLEYAFVYQLRNNLQHFDNIVHSFVAPTKKAHIQPCSSPKKLLMDSRWKECERRFILAAKGNIDLHAAFVNTYNSMGCILVPVMNYLLRWNNSDTSIIMLHSWMESLFTREESKYFYLAKKCESGDCVEIPVWWETIYEIAHSFVPKSDIPR